MQMSRKRRINPDDDTASNDQLEAERPKFLDAFGRPSFPCPMCLEDDKPPTNLPCTHTICVECLLTCPACPSCNIALSPIYTQNVYKMKLSDPDGFKAIVFKTCGLSDNRSKRREDTNEIEGTKSGGGDSISNTYNQLDEVLNEESDKEEEEEEEKYDEGSGRRRKETSCDDLFEDEESDASDDDEIGVVGRYFAFRCLDLTEDSLMFGQVGLAIGKIASTRARGTMYVLDRLMIPFSSPQISSDLSSASSSAAAAAAAGAVAGSSNNTGGAGNVVGVKRANNKTTSNNSGDTGYLLTKCKEYREAFLNEVIDRNDCFVGMGPIAFYPKRVVKINGDAVQVFAIGAMSAQQLEKCAMSL